MPQETCIWKCVLINKALLIGIQKITAFNNVYLQDVFHRFETTQINMQ